MEGERSRGGGPACCSSSSSLASASLTCTSTCFSMWEICFSKMAVSTCQIGVRWESCGRHKGVRWLWVPAPAYRHLDLKITPACSPVTITAHLSQRPIYMYTYVIYIHTCYKTVLKRSCATSGSTCMVFQRATSSSCASQSSSAMTCMPEIASDGCEIGVDYCGRAPIQPPSRAVWTSPQWLPPPRLPPDSQRGWRPGPTLPAPFSGAYAPDAC